MKRGSAIEAVSPYTGEWTAGTIVEIYTGVAVLVSFVDDVRQGWVGIKRIRPAAPLPCPICNGVEGCDHTRAERARAVAEETN